MNEKIRYYVEDVTSTDNGYLDIENYLVSCSVLGQSVQNVISTCEEGAGTPCLWNEQAFIHAVPDTFFYAGNLHVPHDYPIHVEIHSGGEVVALNRHVQ